jgi:hypothetical protein
LNELLRRITARRRQQQTDVERWEDEGGYSTATVANRSDMAHTALTQPIREPQTAPVPQLA